MSEVEYLPREIIEFHIMPWIDEINFGQKCEQLKYVAEVANKFREIDTSYIDINDHPKTFLINCLTFIEKYKHIPRDEFYDIANSTALKLFKNLTARAIAALGYWELVIEIKPMLELAGLLENYTLTNKGLIYPWYRDDLFYLPTTRRDPRTNKPCGEFPHNIIIVKMYDLPKYLFEESEYITYYGYFKLFELMQIDYKQFRQNKHRFEIEYLIGVNSEHN